MFAIVIESAGAEVRARREFKDPHTGTRYDISGRSQTPWSFATAIRADVGEAEAYRQALIRVEIGLQRPIGVNVRGVDFITAIRDGAKSFNEIVFTDVKSSERGRFPAAKKMPVSWRDELHLAVKPGRLRLQMITADAAPFASHGLPTPALADLKDLEQAIDEAAKQNRIRMRQLNASYSPAGQGTITGW